MGPRTRIARIPALVLVAVAAALLAATAIAGVTVYTNSFSSKGGSKELRHAEGKNCQKSWRQKAKKVVVRAKKGKTVCGYRPPVEGDADAPDHYFKATEKMAKSTPKSVRDRVYTGIAVRSGKDVGYELWVFPTDRKFKLARLNGGSKPTFLAKGGNKAIKGRGKANHLGLKAVGSKIIARANGKRLAKTVPKRGKGRRAQGRADARLQEEALEAGLHDRRRPRAAGPQPVARPSSSGWRVSLYPHAMATETLERPRTGGPGSGVGGNWLVIVLNDDHNTFEHVARTLSNVIPGVSIDQGYRFADKIHSAGQAIVWTGLKETAELYWELLKDAGLTMAPLECH